MHASNSDMIYRSWHMLLMDNILLLKLKCSSSVSVVYVCSTFGHTIFKGSPSKEVVPWDPWNHLWICYWNGCRNCSSAFCRGSICRQLSVRRSVHWSESPDHCKLGVAEVIGFFLQPCSKDSGHAYPQSSPPIATFLLAQNLSSKLIAPTDYMQPKLHDKYTCHQWLNG